MSRLYLMLSIAGWLWLVVLCGYVAWRVAGDRRTVRPPDAETEKEPHA